MQQTAPLFLEYSIHLDIHSPTLNLNLDPSEVDSNGQMRDLWCRSNWKSGLNLLLNLAVNSGA
jgi:hypothetical protein